MTTGRARRPMKKAVVGCPDHGHSGKNRLKLSIGQGQAQTFVLRL